jgi:sugar phosphate isomerase/epimerase
MFRSLSPGALGVQVENLEAGLSLAARHGFDGYHFSIQEAAALGTARVKDLCAETHVPLSAWGFPLDFRGDLQPYEQSLAELPALAQTAAELGIDRTATWIMPGSAERTYKENFTFHVERLKPAGAILADHGIRLGLEYVAPKTLWSSQKYPFAHTMEQMAELNHAIGLNLGFLLDSWHWYNARESTADLRHLSVDQVVDVHVNDAPDIPVDDQVDHVRCLPGATGVIDIAGFLSTLKEIGYTGPVMAEPFSQEVRDMDNDAACAATKAGLDKIWGQAGLE